MKTRLFSALIVVSLFLGGCRQADKVTVYGIANADKGDSVYFDALKVDGIKNLQAKEVGRGGRYRLTARAGQPAFYQLRLPGREAFTLVLFPGDKVKINHDSKNSRYTIEGSPLSAQIDSIGNQLAVFKERIGDILTGYDSLQQGDKQNLAEFSRLDSLFRTTVAGYKKECLRFLLKNTHSLASIVVIYQKIDDNTYLFNTFKDIQYFSILSDSLGKYYPEVSQVKSLQYNTSQFINELNQIRLAKLAEGKQPALPDINLPGWRGDSLRLSSLKGKLVLLSFWSPEDRRSVAENIRLKPVYEKFNHRGFEIYQVGMAQSFDLWNRARAFDELTWPGVYAEGGPENPAVRIYNITSLPANYLLDSRQQDILGKNLTAAELEAQLQQLLR